MGEALDLDAIKARSAVATPGWRGERRHPRRERWQRAVVAAGRLAAGRPGLCGAREEDVPALVAQVEAQRAHFADLGRARRGWRPHRRIGSGEHGANR